MKNREKGGENEMKIVRYDIESFRDISRNNAKKPSVFYGDIPRNSPGNSQDFPKTFPENSEDIPKTFPENSEDIPKIFVVKKPKNSENYDVNTLEYCCKILKHLVIGDGRAIKLNEKGLVLINNPDNPVFRLKYCPNCGTKIEHADTDFVEKSIPEPKEILRDKPR